MSGDNLAILLFAWGLAVTFFLEGRRETAWRHWLFWGIAACFLAAGPLWPHMATFWPQGEDFGRRVATDPTAWFVSFMAVTVWITLSKNRQMSETLPTETDEEDVARRPLGKPINWAIWSQRNNYNLNEFSKILAKQDPVRPPNSEAAGFVRLIVDAIRANDLQVQYMGPFPKPANLTVRSHPFKFTVKKADAVAWAKSKSFDVSHIE